MNEVLMNESPVPPKKPLKTPKVSNSHNYDTENYPTDELSEVQNDILYHSTNELNDKTNGVKPNEEPELLYSDFVDDVCGLVTDKPVDQDNPLHGPSDNSQGYPYVSDNQMYEEEKYVQLTSEYEEYYEEEKMEQIEQYEHDNATVQEYEENLRYDDDDDDNYAPQENYRENNYSVGNYEDKNRNEYYSADFSEVGNYSKDSSDRYQYYKNDYRSNAVSKGEDKIEDEDIWSNLNEQRQSVDTITQMVATKKTANNKNSSQSLNEKSNPPASSLTKTSHETSTKKSVALVHTLSPVGYSWDDVVTGKVPNMDLSIKETYLDDDTFMAKFGMDKESFMALPKWKRDNKKKSIGLY